MRAHGTRARYVFDKCRCGLCTGANRAYAEKVNRARIYQRWQPFVDAAPVRDHVASLRARGIGRRQVAALSGVPNSTLSHLIYGKRGHQLEKVRTATASKLLAVQPAPAPGAFVDAGPTWELVHSLIALGYSRSWIARQTGHRHALQLREDRILARNAAAVLQLHRRVGYRRAPASAAATRARNEAARHRWQVSVAWDPREAEAG